MGQALSSLTQPAEAQPPPQFVLVPPMFERDLKGRSRFTKSSYDFLFAKRQLKWLFHDYLQPGWHGGLFLSPPDDPRASVKAKLAATQGEQRRKAHAARCSAAIVTKLLLLLVAGVCGSRPPPS